MKILAKITSHFLFRLALLCCLVILLGAARAEAAGPYKSDGNPLDTAAGVVITAFATSETLDYTDANSHPQPTASPEADLSVTVLPVYGLSIGSLTPVIAVKMKAKVYIDQLCNLICAVTNEGNASDTYNMTFNCNFTNAGTATWDVSVSRYNGGVPELIGILTPSSPTTQDSYPVAEDGCYTFMYSVSLESVNALPRDFITLTTTGTTASTPVGKYRGGNGLWYGGPASETDVSTAEVVRPLLTLDRSFAVDAPSGYSGGTGDPVPGAAITYVIKYTNIGNVSADAVAIFDKVPDNANLAHFNTNFSLPQGQGQYWTIYYSTLEAPTKSFTDNTGWTLIGSLEKTTQFPGTGETYSYLDPQFSAKWVKWHKGASGFEPRIDLKPGYTLTWGVTIR